MSRYSRWWTAGQPEDAWEAALSRASAECRAGLARGLQGRKGNDGWPERDPPAVIAARHRRWEREKPFAADTLTFKRGPVMDFTRIRPDTQSLSGSAAAMAAEAA